ncbi:zinc finger domain, LSD1 subclass, putative [Trypanosoma equiperdum]|uniref:Zinc finger LSD1-type domain-containing protein n=4 Tax=Trypanozoon TaxID=39700 RepID=Q583D9_TRYB2|nr:hypothetical protein, conserved [Trypanosoma brucei gambiense DAL972]XP_844603.1 hypothetical protein, conserved [Trypanosoma brucei brucei TREU927]AAX80516.1 hypothetical protein, conserved [Trypanosoma brucei]RHW72986.1 zinc finger domain [Trypanosoma brucei equiperdum]SCU69159.1 zinc finger domain, LSD1 subclass, putative [Trypanosoma equiperdum]AAZ11044.1 hypothetical protein, conserved [Trypanosoma brucei brucei TREU927]CBH10769.1 hypothetical protein, conserved [Trypanosoma brucei ga|eukprot:XP_011773057.1 hypothetical protein, conserved [Trypanosoma brucei gambiense DAL972]
MPSITRCTGQIICQGCQVTLAYPIGAPSVRCPLCASVTHVRQFSVTCVQCRVVLILAQNTSLAMCPQCRVVMSIPACMRDGWSSLFPPEQCVYIERPVRAGASRTLPRIAVGTKLDDDEDP